MEKPIPKKPDYLCVHCTRVMKYSYGSENGFSVPFCSNPACPNFQLLQVGIPAVSVIGKKIKGTATLNGKEFPIHRITSGGMTGEELYAEIKNRGFKIDYATTMLKSKDFLPNKEKQTGEYVILSVNDLFNDNQIHTYPDIIAKAKDYGLELCPQDLAPHWRLQLTHRPLDEWFVVASMPVFDRDGYPRVFSLRSDFYDQWLFSNWAEPRIEWNPGYRIAFSLRKSAGNKRPNNQRTIEENAKKIERSDPAPRRSLG